MMLAVLSLVFPALLGAASPGPAASASPGAPLRQLTYAFSVHKEGMAGPEYSGADSTVANSPGDSTTDGGQGTMQADVLSVTADGALLVRISEKVDSEPQARQAYTCTVYGDTTVTCPSAPAPSQAEWLLLSYLGRRFVDGAPWDAHGHWQQTQTIAKFTLHEDFTKSGDRDPKHVVVHESKVFEMSNGGFSSQREDIRITYDRSMEVPTAIHDDLVSTGDPGSTGHATFDFSLKNDSFAK
ncbi:MAG: hypothetical protein WB757_08190 [Candidatus Cybelea sp.]|jgi:hypothetical protein